MQHLTIDGERRLGTTRSNELFSTALSNCLLRTPPLRSTAIAVRVVPSTAALRHVGRSTQLIQLELEAAALTAMVWRDRLDLVRPWRGAKTVQSLVLHSRHFDAPHSSLKAACVAFASLTHLHVQLVYSDNDAFHYIARHLGDRLTFLRLSVNASSPAPECSAMQSLQSLYLTIDSATPDLLNISAWLRLLPRLSELLILDERLMRDGGTAAVVVSPLPATLTYLQLRSRHQPPVTLSGSSGADEVVDLTALLPPTLLCLSLTLPYIFLTPSLLDSIPRQCGHLTHCHIMYAEHNSLLSEDEDAEWTERVELRSELAAGVWCDDSEAVEQQRLDRRWQRDVG